MSAELEKFRETTRVWLEENCPASMRTPMPDAEVVWGGRNARFANPDAKLWLDRMVERGWTAPTWSTRYGGGGLTPEEDQIFQSEMARIQARPPLRSFGLMMLGPALMEFASEEQKDQYLPQFV